MGMRELFYPRGVAVFGSVSEGKLAGILIRQALQAGYEKVFAVNPKGAGIEGVAGHTSLAEIPEPVDLALIAAPAPTVAGILEACGQRGVKAAIVITSGFSEMGNLQGEQELVAVAKRYGISFIGPNCAGLLNTHHNLSVTLQAYPPKGNTAIVSQSGAVGGAIMEWAQSQGLGISKFVSYGNGASLNQADFLRYLKDDPETGVVGLYIENISDGREFMEALGALAAVKPVVVIKSGRTGTGKRAAQSHTGSMAGADAVYEAAIHACGAIRADSLDELIDLCKGFQYLPPVQGNRVAIITNSGGPGVMTADLGEELGMDVAEPSESTKESLRQFLPSFAGYSNPIDLTVEGTGENYRKSIEIMLESYDAALPIFFGPPYLDTRPMAQGMVDAARHAKKPVLCALETGLHAAESVQLIREGGLPNFASTERAIRTLAGMYRYEAQKKKLRAHAPVKAAEPIAYQQSQILEPQAAALLKEAGLPLPPWAFAQTKAEAVTAGRRIGYPVVFKVVSPQIIHKSDFGGVVLHIQSDIEAQRAFDTIAQNAAQHDFRGIMVYPMLKPGKECILGFTRDPQFGPVIAFGMGGIFTEVLKDISLRVAPVSVEGALDMMRDLRCYPILAGARGQVPVDLEALARLIADFSQMPFLYPGIKEADLNPVFAYADRAVIGDVRLIV